MSRSFPRNILAISRHDQWPEPLGSLVVEGLAIVDCAQTLHEAAAAFVLSRQCYHALLVDVEVLGSHELAKLSVVRRHISQPMWLLPHSARRTHLRAALAQGAIPWEDAARVLTQWLQKGTTPVSQVSNRENPQEILKDFIAPDSSDSEPRRRPDAADKSPRIDPENNAEIPVVADIVARYDGLAGTPLLSEHEIRALLGTSE
jgi:hypothetical protein